MNTEFNYEDAKSTPPKPTSTATKAKYILVAAAWIALFGFAIFEIV